MAEGDTRVMRLSELAPTELAERIALFAVVSRHPRASLVLAGLSASLAPVAQRLLDAAAGWSSSKRQARDALEFGHSGDQQGRGPLCGPG